MKRAPKKTKIDIAALRQDLSYNPATGEMSWTTNSRHNEHAGKVAGYKKADGYWRIKYREAEWLGHILVWAWVYGAVPEELQIDHINNDRADNRIVNLQLLTPLENMAAVRDRRRRGSKLPLGVTKSSDGAFIAQIGFKGECIYLGRFKTPNEAAAAYQRAAVQAMRGDRPALENRKRAA